MAIFQSPTNQDQPLNWNQSNNDEMDEENLLKVKLFFHSDEKSMKARLFTDEWYTVMAAEVGEDQVSRDFEPWLEVSPEHSAPCLQVPA